MELSVCPCCQAVWDALVFAVVVVVVVGRGWHPLLVARRRVENLAILS